MDIFRLRSRADDYQNLLTVQDSDWDRFVALWTTPDAVEWEAVNLEMARLERPSSDFPSLMLSVPVFSQKAVRVLDPLLKQHGQFLPVHTQVGDYIAYHTTTVLDAVDLERSEMKRFSSGRIMNVIRYEFRPGSLDGSPIFKLANMPSITGIFVTGEFVAAVDEAGLIGFDFKKV